MTGSGCLGGTAIVTEIRYAGVDLDRALTAVKSPFAPTGSPIGRRIRRTDLLVG